MEQFIEKLIGRLEEEPVSTIRMGKDYIVNGNALPKERMLEIVKELAEEYNNGWIPCSERLPNKNEIWIGNDITDAEPREFIVMVKGAYIPTTGYYTVDGWVKDIYDKENGSGYANEIVAWRFFPQPYQPKGE